MRGLTLDTGALLALERRASPVQPLLSKAIGQGREIRVPAGVLAQAWREPARQALLATLLKRRYVIVVPLDAAAARATGILCAASGTSDVVDASVALCALAHDDHVVTSDPIDLARLVGPNRVVAI